MNARRVLGVVTVALLVGCGGEKNGAGGGKDTLVIAFKASPTNLDWRVGNDQYSGRASELYNSGLVKVTPNFDYAPDVATKWETPDDRTIIFHLNPAAKFHTGQPVKAADVKWTYDSLMAPGFVSPKKSGYAAVDHIEAPDDHTVIFRLKTPNPGIFDNLTLGILPTGADTNIYKTKPIGCGPYKVVEYQPDDRLVLEAFDQWHGGVPKIKHVIIRMIPDATTLVLELKRGSVQFEVNCTLPRLSSSTSVVASGIMRMMTCLIFGTPPCHWSKASSTRRSSGWYSTTLYGPQPIGFVL